jgi:hypothetical protein
MVLGVVGHWLRRAEDLAPVVDDVPPPAATRGFVLPLVAAFAVATAWFRGAVHGLGTVHASVT